MGQNEKVTFTRQQLYDLVWAEPLLSLSRKYNISDNGLRKICINMGVPTPVAGYWAKIQHGQSPPVKPLPPPGHYDQKETTLYFRDENHPALVDGMTPVAAMQQVIERDHAAELKVSINTLNDPDPLIIKARVALLKRNEYYRDGDILHTESGQLNIRVSDPQINRALGLMDAFVKIMRKRSHDFKFRNECTYVVIGEEDIEVALRETSTVTVREDRWQTRDLNPNGKLELKFGSYEPTVTGRDGKVPIEEQLAKIIARLELMAEEMRVKTIESKIRRAEYDEKERIRKMAAERQKLEISSFREAVRNANRWQETNNFRSYIYHIEQQALITDPLDEETLAWVEWAKKKADWYDPLVESEDEWLKGQDRNTILAQEAQKPSGSFWGSDSPVLSAEKSKWPLLPWYMKNK